MHDNIYCYLYIVGEDSGQSNPEKRFHKYILFLKKLNDMGGKILRSTSK